MKRLGVVMAVAFAAAVSVAPRVLHAESESENEGGDDGEGGGSSSSTRPAHDVACSLHVAPGATAGATDLVKLALHNRGKSNETVNVSVHQDSATGPTLWSGDVSVASRHRAGRKVKVDVPSGTTSLVAVATCSSDARPGDNVDQATLGSSSKQPYAAAGAATFAANCASCHGANAQGTSRAPSLLHRSAGDVYEATREGDDGMPRFSWITTQNARDIAAFLADPSAVTAPSTTPPTTTPPSSGGATPTYTGQVKAILDASCATCHTSMSNAPAGVHLASYSGAVASASQALAAMKAGRMPPGGPLSAATIQVVSDWVAGGMKR